MKLKKSSFVLLLIEPVLDCASHLFILWLCYTIRFLHRSVEWEALWGKAFSFPYLQSEGQKTNILEYNNGYNLGENLVSGLHSGSLLDQWNRWESSSLVFPTSKLARVSSFYSCIAVAIVRFRRIQ